MNCGAFVKRALNRAKLSVIDVGYKNLGFEILNEIAQEFWNMEFWQFRRRPLSLATVNGTEEYSLDRLVPNIQSVIPNTMRGSNPVRQIIYEPSHEFYRSHAYSLQSGDPYRFREGQLQGFSTDPTSASAISFTSSLSNYTTGNVNVTKGSKRVVFGGGATITLDMLGLYFAVSGDERIYKLQRRDYNSSSIYYLDEPYEGADDSSASYTLGDIGQRVTILGYVSGQLQEEEIKLNGENAVATSKSYTSLVRISKSGKTGGYITGTSNSGAVTNVILDPSETSLNIQTIKLYPIPTKAETINYEAYIRHPYICKESDSLLFPTEFAPLIQLEMKIRIDSEFKENEPNSFLLGRRQELIDTLVRINNSTDNWTVNQESEYASMRTRLNNLPANYGADDYDF